jgi:hypothetical protein
MRSSLRWAAIASGVRISPFGRLFDMPPYAGEAEAWVAVGSFDRESGERPAGLSHPASCLRQ